MLGAMTHPSRALNLDIKQSFFMPKSDINVSVYMYVCMYIYVYVCKCVCMCIYNKVSV